LEVNIYKYRFLSLKTMKRQIAYGIGLIGAALLTVGCAKNNSLYPAETNLAPIIETSNNNENKPYDFDTVNLRGNEYMILPLEKSKTAEIEINENGDEIVDRREIIPKQRLLEAKLIPYNLHSRIQNPETNTVVFSSPNEYFLVNRGYDNKKQKPFINSNENFPVTSELVIKKQKLEEEVIKSNSGLTNKRSVEITEPELNGIYINNKLFYPILVNNKKLGAESIEIAFVPADSEYFNEIKYDLQKNSFINNFTYKGIFFTPVLGKEVDIPETTSLETRIEEAESSE